MGHLEIKRSDYPELLVAIARDLKVVSDMGVDKAAVRRINADLMTVGGELKALFEKYGGYGSSKVKLGYHSHLFSGKQLSIDSSARRMLDKAA